MIEEEIEKLFSTSTLEEIKYYLVQSNNFDKPVLNTLLNRCVQIHKAKVDYNIADNKKIIRRFKNCKKWYKPFNYFVFTDEQIEDYIRKYLLLLKFNVHLKRLIIKKHGQSNQKLNMDKAIKELSDHITGKYILKNKKPVPEPDIIKWGKRLSNKNI